MSDTQPPAQTHEFRLRSVIWRLRCLFFESRDETATEATLRAEVASLGTQLASAKSEVAELRAELAAQREEAERERAKHAFDCDALKYEVKTITEMHERIVARIRAETSGYLARIPDTGQSGEE